MSCLLDCPLGIFRAAVIVEQQSSMALCRVQIADYRTIHISQRRLPREMERAIVCW